MTFSLVLLLVLAAPFVLMTLIAAVWAAAYYLAALRVVILAGLGRLVGK